MDLSDIETPSLVVDLDRVEANVAEMADLARRADVRLRPHTKTHKMTDIARLQVEAGATGITCAKLGEAEVMAAAGFRDILVAFPLHGPRKLERLRKLRESARVLVSVDSLQVARGLGEVGVASGDPLEVYVEVDTGLHRLGRAPGAPSVELVTRIAEVRGIEIVGLMSHAGHAYGASSPQEMDAIVSRELADLVETQRQSARAGIIVPEISVGSTPTVRAELSRPGVTEVRPGTYVFNDTTMIRLGVATQATCAAYVVATVVSRPSVNRFVVDAGTKCLAADGIGRAGWVQVMGRDDLAMEFLNEEHGVGIIRDDSDTGLAIGDRIRIIPSHVCPVINLFDRATAIRADEVVGELLIPGRGKVQ
jgi:D-serine deaminase-like pyridoxal phosphate-dependent protein